MRQYDILCRRFIAMRAILARIVKGTVRECRSYRIEEIEAMLGEPELGTIPLSPSLRPQEIREDESADKVPGEGAVYFDLVFRLYLPEGTIALVVNIEIQDSGTFSVTIPRGIFYLARLISRQKNRDFQGDDYRHLLKVYSIWIMTSPDRSKAYVGSFHLEKTDLVGHLDIPKEIYDKLELVVVCVGDTDGLSWDKDIKDTVQLLDTAFRKELPFERKERILRDRFGVRLTPDERKEVEHMCNLGEAMYLSGERSGLEKGERMGLEKGERMGLEKGERMGSTQTLINSVRSLIGKTGWSVDEAINTLDVPVQYQSAVRKAVLQQG